MGLVRRLKASPALVVACVALLVSLTGTSVAAVSQLGKGTVGTAQLKNNAVTSKKVKNKTLVRADFKSGALLRGPRGLRGLTGAAGPAGAAGAAGAQGPIGPSTVYHARFAFSPGGTAMPGSGFTTYHTLNLPAGSYTAIATLTAENNGGANDAALCELVPSTGDLARYVGSAVPGEFAEVSATVAFTLPAAGTVLLRCIGNLPAGTMVRNQSTLTAIKVGEVIQQ
jgi:hypothetical protein